MAEPRDRGDDVVDEVVAGLLAREVHRLLGDALDLPHAETEPCSLPSTAIAPPPISPPSPPSVADGIVVGRFDVLGRAGNLARESSTTFSRSPCW